MSDLVQPKSFEPTYTPTYGPEAAAAVQRTAKHVAPIRESMSRAWEPADLEGRPADFVTRTSDTLATFSYRDFLMSKIYPGDTLAVAERNAAGYARSVGLPEPRVPDYIQLSQNDVGGYDAPTGAVSTDIHKTLLDPSSGGPGMEVLKHEGSHAAALGTSGADLFRAALKKKLGIPESKDPDAPYPMVYFSEFGPAAGALQRIYAATHGGERLDTPEKYDRYISSFEGKSDAEIDRLQVPYEVKRTLKYRNKKDGAYRSVIDKGLRYVLPATIASAPAAERFA
jgi:hypothetical protein